VLNPTDKQEKNSAELNPAREIDVAERPTYAPQLPPSKPPLQACNVSTGGLPGAHCSILVLVRSSHWDLGCGCVGVSATVLVEGNEGRNEANLHRPPATSSFRLGAASQDGKYERNDRCLSFLMALPSSIGICPKSGHGP
jgi:hypothetical protein